MITLNVFSDTDYSTMSLPGAGGLVHGRVPFIAICVQSGGGECDIHAC